jgi:hypothetical protein
MQTTSKFISSESTSYTWSGIVLSQHFSSALHQDLIQKLPSLQTILELCPLVQLPLYLPPPEGLNTVLSGALR